MSKRRKSLPGLPSINLRALDDEIRIASVAPAVPASSVQLAGRQSRLSASAVTEGRVSQSASQLGP